MIRAIVLILFLLTGATGLVYQVAWTRLLVLILGNSTHAVTVILASFMLGLALGAHWLGRLVDRPGARPLRLYAGLEVIVGGLALVMPTALNIVTKIYLTVGTTSPVLKFVMAFIVLVAPAVAMGGTLPILSRWVVTSLEGVGGKLGALYGANTFGAVAGSFLAGFVMIERYGVVGSTTIAAAVNFAVAGVAYLLSAKFEKTVETDAPTAAASATETPAEADGEFDPATIRLVAIAFGVTGFCALAYEVLWTRMLVFFLQGFTWAFCAMLTTFLFGLAAGAMVFGWWVNRVRYPVRFLAILITATTVAVGGALVLLGEMYAVMKVFQRALEGDLGLGHYGYTLFAGSFTVMVVPTLLMGGVFPAVGRIVTRHVAEVGGTVGRVYAVNTLGAVLGSIVAGLILIPTVGVKVASLIVLGIHVAVGLWLAWRATGLGRTGRVVLTGCGLVALIGTTIGIAPGEPLIRASHVFHGSYAENRELLTWREGAVCAVSVVEDTALDFRMLFTDEFQAATSADEYRYMRMLGHLPLFLSKERDDVLVIAFGTGTTAGSVATHDGVKVLDVVEISQEVLDVAPYFEKVNKNVLTRAGPPEVRAHVMDGRHFVMTTDRRYDVVTLEPLMPYTPAAVNLYTKEFYELCRKVLKPGGVMCQWIPIHATTIEDYRMLARSFTEVFPHASIWLFDGTSAIIGTLEPLSIDYATVAERLGEPRVRADLREVGLDDAAAILSSFVLGEGELTTYLQDAVTMTDEHPYMEFKPRWLNRASADLSDMVGEYYRISRQVAPHVDFGRVDPDRRRTEQTRLDRREAMALQFRLGLHHEEAFRFLQIHDLEAATVRLREALNAYRASRAVAPRLSDRVLDGYFDRASHSWLLTHARGLIAEGHTAKAIVALAAATKLAPPGGPHQAWYELGRALRSEGRFDEAEEAFRRALAIVPKSKPYREELGALLAQSGGVKPLTADEVVPIVESLWTASPAGERDALQRLRTMRLRGASVVDEALRDVEADVHSVDVKTETDRARAMRWLITLKPAWLDETSKRVLDEKAQGTTLRGMAARELIRLGQAGDVHERLNFGDAATRILVADALGQMKDRTSVHRLVDLLADPESDVRKAAHVALFTITGHQDDPDGPAADRVAVIARWRKFLIDWQ